MVVGGSAELVVRDVVGLREGMDGAEVAAEEGIDEGRLAGVDLTADGEKKWGPETGLDFCKGELGLEIDVRLRRELGDAEHEV